MGGERELARGQGNQAGLSAARIWGLLQGHEKAREADRPVRAQASARFDLMEVLDAGGDEIRHGRVLAWLVDADPAQYGTHGQGNLGFRLFLRETGLPGELAEGHYRVQREVAGQASRVDLEVAGRGRFLIHVENKVWSPEGREQTRREWQDVLRRAGQLGIGDARRTYALYLTPEGRPAECEHFRAVTWRQVGRALEAFGRTAGSAEVRLFAGHCGRAMQRRLAGVKGGPGNVYRL